MQLMACLSLGAIFFAPIWQIILEAPQFPEGLKLYIWLDELSGESEQIIQNINILNHYIGMQAIEPDSIKELKYFPIVISVLILIGIVLVFVNKWPFYLSFSILLVALSAIGVYDFYLWLYDFGHNLDPDAPIEIPGMSYMPPVIGEKDLLNFRAKSYPHFGTLFYFLAIVFSFLAYSYKKKELA